MYGATSTIRPHGHIGVALPNPAGPNDVPDQCGPGWKPLNQAHCPRLVGRLAPDDENVSIDHWVHSNGLFHSRP